MGDVVWPLFLSALSAMAKVFVLGGVGVLGGLYPKADPILSKATLRGLSRVLTNVVIPASLLAGWGSSLSVEVMSTLWLIIPWAGLNLLLSTLVAWPLFRLVRLDPQLTVVLTATCAFHNAVSLPLLLLDSLCQQGALPSVENCRQRAVACCFVYLIPFHFLFWTVGYSILTRRYEPALDIVVPSPSTLEAPLGADAAFCPLSPTSASHAFLEAESQRQVLVSPRGNKRTMLIQSASSLTSTIRRLFLNPAILSMPVALVISLVTPLREGLFGHGSALQPVGSAISTLADTLLGISTLVLAGSLVAQDGWLRGAHIPKKAALIPLFIGVRLVAVPAVGLAAVYAAKRWSPACVGDPLMQTTLMVEFASPSAMSAVVLLQAAGSQDLASLVAYLYVFQHLAATVLLTVATTAAMYIATLT